MPETLEGEFCMNRDEEKDTKSVTMQYKKDIAESIGTAIGIPVEEVLVVSTNHIFGDLAVNCTPIARKLGRNPVELARELGTSLQGTLKEFSLITNEIPTQNETKETPFLNFKYDYEIYAKKVLSNILREGERYGSLEQGLNQRSLVEYGSINPNASPHMGRIRNVLVGDFFARLEGFVGYDVERHYLVNDIGKQIALLKLGIDKYSPNELPSFDEMLGIYIKINKDAESDPQINVEAQNNLKLLEEGDKEIRRDLRRVVDICLEGQLELLSQLDVEFDVFTYESDLVLEEGLKQEIIKRLVSSGKAYYDEDNRLIADLSGYGIPTKNPVLVLTRGDGASLYPLRDILYTIRKNEKSKENNFIVLGEDQRTYMQQISAVMDILGYKAPEGIFYSFVLLKGGKMATRDGKVALLSDVLTELKERLERGFRSRGYEGELDSEKLKRLAGAAVKYSMLGASRTKNVNFDIDVVSDFNGDSGVALLYANSRIKSILRKFDKDEDEIDLEEMTFEFPEDIEKSILHKIGEFPELVESLLIEREGMPLVRYLGDLKKTFSRYYEEVKILDELDSENRRMSKVLLIKALSQVMENGMRILGIEPIENF